MIDKIINEEQTDQGTAKLPDELLKEVIEKINEIIDWINSQ